mmetsp:Transcript_61259/g.171303  ORF Transcript_61259/g.171303 Transcript_61259/m.171303 type:complete len:274 (+) Transcript_61259:65-886(+)
MELRGVTLRSEGANGTPSALAIGDAISDETCSIANKSGEANMTEGTQAQDDVQVFCGEWDAEGVYVYQAFCDEIADWALEHQQFGGPHFNTTRMTWIKPSFAWVLYRSGYGHKHGQKRILKVKVPHHEFGEILGQCQCVDTNRATRTKRCENDGGSNGRVQWDPGRDILSSDGRQPRLMRRHRAIQIGMAGRLSELYVRSVISIQDVTELGHRVGQAHRSKKADAMAHILPELPDERPYKPRCPDHVLVKLGMLPGGSAAALSRIGKGKALQR